MSRVKLNIIGLSTGQTSGSYTLILGEENGERKLPIIIGAFEAQAIAIEIERIVPFRPMTHDLFVNFCKAFNIEIHEVVIYNLHEGVFHAKLVCEQDGVAKEIDARTSDSIAIAVRFKCPIYTFEDIMESASVFLRTESTDEIESEDSDIEDDDFLSPRRKSGSDLDELRPLTLDQLNKRLEEAIKTEDYSLAARIRDEIKNRKDK